MKLNTWLLVGLLLSIGQISIAQQLPHTAGDKAIGNGQPLAQRPTAVFEENKGQMKDQHWQPRPDVLYYGNAAGMDYYIRNTGTSYQLTRVECWKEEEDHKRMPGTPSKQVPDEIGTYRVDAEWLGHNPDFTVGKGCALDGYNNYYNVPKGTEPALFVKQYEAVTLKNLWNGVDVHYYSTEGQLETDYIVAPGADYRQIRMEIKGAELSISTDGHLVMKTPFGEIHEGKLKVYQGDQLVAANWIIMGNVVSFDIPQFDPCLALRIDPLVRVWGTYCGGSEDDIVKTMSLDAAENIYIGGYTISQNNISSGGHQNGVSGSEDGFLVKYNESGNRLWGTYYGGSLPDFILGCDADNNNNVYITGVTYSTFNIASPGSYQDTIADQIYFPFTNPEAYLVKLNSSGILQWGTYYGSIGMEGAYACSVDNNGDVIIVGYAQSSSDFVLNGHQNSYGGGNYDGFIAKFSSTGVRVWSSFYGGSDQDHIAGCATDAMRNIYFFGYTRSTNNIAQNGYQNSSSNGGIFLVKMNSSGSRLWGTYYSDTASVSACAVDKFGNVYITGNTRAKSNIAFNGHQNTITPSIYTGITYSEAYLVKFDPNGARQWATYYGGNYEEDVLACAIDTSDNVYIAGWSSSPDNIASDGYQNVRAPSTGISGFLAKFNPSGIRQWGTYFYGRGNGSESIIWGCAVNKSGSVYITGTTDFRIDIAINGQQTMYGGGFEGYLVKFSQDRIYGIVWQDTDADCVRDSNEAGIVDKMRFSIQPGNRVAQSHGGTWSIDSLPAGSYTVTIDTTNKNWIYTCPITQTFTITNPSGVTTAPSFGVKAKYPCPKPFASITTDFFRRGFPNQPLHVTACNLNIATDSLLNAYVLVELDPNITVQSCSRTAVNLGNNNYRVNLDNLGIDECVSFYFMVTVELTAIGGQTLCSSVELFPQPACSFDSIPFAPLHGAHTSPCTLPYDNSLLTAAAYCGNDSVKLVVYNTGAGNMGCFAPVIIYRDAQVYRRDSVKLNVGDSIVYKFIALNKTWHIQTAQHPLNFTAEPYPTAGIELCGTGMWSSSGLISALPTSDLRKPFDINCVMVNAPYDPNDKTGFPLGTGVSNNILPDGEIEYLIRFQNVGTDTAFNVVIRDTLEMDLDIMSVRSGASSHPYEFRMYGQRVLEWRFENIQLPDSTSNEPGSHGFVTFKVKQMPNLPDGTVIENTAGIYFDFEAPVITNTYAHTVARNVIAGCTPTTSTATETACGSYMWNGTTYTQGGTYTYQTTNAAGCDSTATLVLTINSPTASTATETACGSYTWNGTTYTQGGTYTYQTTNAAGCDSTATLVLTINSPTTSTNTETACGSYTWNGTTYTQGGTYTYQTTNAAGCDSTATLVLTINSPTTSTATETACGSYTWNGTTYTQGGTYTYHTTNAAGCDSTATLVLTVETDFSASDTIAGSTVADTLQAYTYSVPAGSVGDGFQWGVSCGSITTGQGTNAVTVSFDGPDTCALWVIRSNAACTDTLALSVAIDFGSGIGEKILSDITLYPNPTSGLTTLTWGGQAALAVTVMDALGRTVTLPMECLSNSCTLDTRTLSAGVYTVVLSHPGGMAAKKLIKTQ